MFLFYSALVPISAPPGSFLLTAASCAVNLCLAESCELSSCIFAATFFMLVLIFMWLWDKTDWNTDLAGNRRAKIPPALPPAPAI